MTLIRTIETSYDGYERLYRLELIDTKELIWAYGLNPDKYITDKVETYENKVGPKCRFLH